VEVDEHWFSSLVVAAADTMALEAGYGEFTQKAQALTPAYHPCSVYTVPGKRRMRRGGGAFPRPRWCYGIKH
jgi:hypothetical protein